MRHSVLLVSASLLVVGWWSRSDAAPAGDDKNWAPSTGREMPKEAPKTVDPATARAALDAGVAAAEKAHDADACSKAIDQIFPAAVALDIKPVESSKPVFVALARCARESKRYQVLEAVSRLAPAFVQSSDLALALFGQERYRESAKELQQRLARTPQDALLLAMAARLDCKVHDFAKCRIAADKALAAATRGHDQEATVAAALANVGRWQSATMLGDYRTAHAALEALPPRVRTPLAAELVPAETAKLGVELTVPSMLALGTYHLAGRVNRDLVDLVLGNGSPRDRQLRVSVEIAGVSSATVKSVVVLGHKPAVLHITPPLLATFATETITSPRRVQLDVKITEGKDVVYEQSRPIDLMPHDYLPTFEKIGEDSIRPVWENAAAWVTPNDPAVEQLLTSAKARLVGRQSFSGLQSATLPQVQAIFDELKARGVSYVSDPSINSDRFVGQRTRLPAQVLASTNAQCLEGTLMFASALEAIGLDPILVRVPGHAFVGWHASPKDKSNEPLLYVETTMVHNAPFENAVKTAVDRVVLETKQGHFKNGMSSLLEIKALRRKGVTPQASAATR